MTIQEFANSLGLTMTAERLPATHPNHKANMFNWLVRITNGSGGQFETTFFCGGAHVTKRDPKEIQRRAIRARMDDVFPSDIAKARKAENVHYDFEKGHYWLAFARSMTRSECLALGVVFTAKAPELDTVLDALASDASALDSGSFEDWCSELGYDADSREAERIYKACIDNGLRLRGFLGSAELDRLMYECERL